MGGGYGGKGGGEIPYRGVGGVTPYPGAKLTQEDEGAEIIEGELLETVEEEALSEFDATDDGSEGEDE
ncbi:hypothetical protein KCA24_34840, partial [Escherichia coli]|nr:hypothetical protein [Escherichia coli]